MPHNPSRPRIAILSALDVSDQRTWSGTPLAMMKALARAAGDVEQLGPVQVEPWILGKAANRISRILSRRAIDYQHTLLRARRLGAFFTERLRSVSCDVIVAPAASTEIAFIETRIPIILAADAHFHILRQYYDFYSDLWPWSERSADEIERAALRRCAAVVYPTSWPVDSAVTHYGIDRRKVHIVPYGANIDAPPPRDAILRRSCHEPVRLLFLGVEWERKGGPIALETMDALHAMGIPAELTVVGCTPPSDVRSPSIRVIPFIDKNTREGRRHFDEILLGSDLLLLPTRAEAFGIVFCEAGAFGLPSITTSTGGVPGVITHGGNGLLHPIDARGDEYAQSIASLVRSPALYRTMVQSSRDLYDQRLNWTAWGESMGSIIAGTLINNTPRQ